MNESVLIVGAGLGLSASLARLCASKNMNIVLAARNIDKLRDLKKEILNELENSKKLFKKYNWPIINITRKSVEETAASIIKILDILNSR